MKTIESLSKEMETLSTDTEDIKKKSNGHFGTKNNFKKLKRNSIVGFNNRVKGWEKKNQ